MFMHDMAGWFSLVILVHVDFRSRKTAGQILDRLGRDGRVLAGRSLRSSRPRKTPSVVTFEISRDAAFVAASTAARCRSRRLRARLKSAPARRSIARRRWAAALAALIVPNSLVFVDSGSTNLAAAKAFPDNIRLTAATHDPAIAAVLMAKREVTLWLIGGRVDPRMGAALGGRTLADVEALRPDLALLGVCALDPTAGRPRSIRKTPRSNGRSFATPRASPPRSSMKSSKRARLHRGPRGKPGLRGPRSGRAGIGRLARSPSVE